MKQEPYMLDLPRAWIVLEAIREVWRFRDWELIAAHVRTAHVHVIVDRPQNARLSTFALGANARKLWSRGGQHTASLNTRNSDCRDRLCARPAGRTYGANACAGPDSAGARSTNQSPGGMRRPGRRSKCRYGPLTYP